MNAKRLITMLPVAVLLVATIVVPVALAQESREARLVRLDQVFRLQGVEAWLKAAGLSWTELTVKARQPEEETIPFKGATGIVVSGIQVEAKNLKVNWPAVVTTDDPSRIKVEDSTRQYRPDLRNLSVIYTNVTLNGIGTIWVDGSNWPQLWPEGYVPAGQVAPTPTAIPPAAAVQPTAVPPTAIPPAIKWIVWILLVIGAITGWVLAIAMAISCLSHPPVVTKPESFPPAKPEANESQPSPLTERP